MTSLLDLCHNDGVVVARVSFQHWERQRQIETIKHYHQTVMGGI